MSTENLCSVTEQATVQAMVESINNGMTPQGSTTPDSNCSAKEKEQSAQLVSVSAILSCRPFFILIFLPCIKMNHYGFSRKSIWKNLETFP